MSEVFRTYKTFDMHQRDCTRKMHKLQGKINGLAKLFDESYLDKIKEQAMKKKNRLL